MNLSRKNIINGVVITVIGGLIVRYLVNRSSGGLVSGNPAARGGGPVGDGPNFTGRVGSSIEEVLTV